MYSRFGSPPSREGTFWSDPFFRHSEKFLSVDLFLQAAKRRLKRDCNSSVKISKERPTMVAARCDQHVNGCPFRLRALRSESGTSWSVPTKSCQWKHVHPGETPSPTPSNTLSNYDEDEKTQSPRTVVLYKESTYFDDARAFFAETRARSQAAYGYPCYQFRHAKLSLISFCTGRNGPERCEYKVRATRCGTGWRAAPWECNWTHSHDANTSDTKPPSSSKGGVSARQPKFTKVSEIRFPDDCQPPKKFPAEPQVDDVFKRPGVAVVAAVANAVLRYGVSTEDLWCDFLNEVLACKHSRNQAAECEYRMKLGRLDDGSRIVLADSNLSHSHDASRVTTRINAWCLAQNPPYILAVVALKLGIPMGRLPKASRPASTSDSRDAKRRRLSSPSRTAAASASLAGPSGLSHQSDRILPRTTTQGAERKSGAAAKPAVKQEPEQDELDAAPRSPGPRAGNLKEAVVLAGRASSTSVKKEEDLSEALPELNRPDAVEEIPATSSESPHRVASGDERPSTAFEPEAVQSSSDDTSTQLSGPSASITAETARVTDSSSDARDAAEAKTPSSEPPTSKSAATTVNKPPPTSALPESSGISVDDQVGESGPPGVVESSACAPPSRLAPPAPQCTPLAPKLCTTSAASEDPDEPDPRQVRLDAVEAFLLAIEPALVPSASALLAAGIDSHQALFDFASLAPAIRRTLLRRLDKQAAGSSTNSTLAGLARVFPS